MKRISCIAVEKNGKFLLLKRASQDRYPNLWEMPGGRIEEGETEEECARRELFEETGLRISSMRFVRRVKRNSDHETLEVNYFYVMVSNGKIKLSGEHSDFIWLAKGQMARMGRLPEDASPSANWEGRLGTEAFTFISKLLKDL